MFSVQVIIPILVIAAVCMGVLYWRSKREEDRAREASEKLRPIALNDPLSEPRPSDLMASGPAEGVEPVLAAGNGAGADRPDPDAEFEPREPSAEPPLYRLLEKEDEAEKAAAVAAAEEVESDRPAEAGRGREFPPIDPMVEWVLDISPREGSQFALGGVQSLKIEVDRLNLPLQFRVWAQSARDGLYYEADEVTSPARHVVASLVLANRTARLDDVGASRFFQVLEQCAAQNDVALRRDMEPAEAVRRSAELKRFIEYYDRSVELRIAPVAEGETFAYDRVEAVAAEAGFAAASARWDLHFEADELDPVITLAFGPEGTRSLTLALSLPLANESRGDLKRFFALANDLSAKLDGVWADCTMRPIDAGGAMMIADSVSRHARMMASGGVRPGSERARLLFAR